MSESTARRYCQHCGFEHVCNCCREVSKRDQTIAEKDAQIAELQAQIDDGRCCDDFERLPKCGHPRCVVSETCEICVELGSLQAEAREEEREACAMVAETYEENGYPLEAPRIASAIRARGDREGSS